MLQGQVGGLQIVAASLAEKRKMVQTEVWSAEEEFRKAAEEETGQLVEMGRGPSKEYYLECMDQHRIGFLLFMTCCQHL